MMSERGEDEDGDKDDQAPLRQRKRSKCPRKQQDMPTASQPPPTTSSSGPTQEVPLGDARKESRVKEDAHKHLVYQILDAGIHIDDANDPKMQEKFFWLSLLRKMLAGKANESWMS